MIVSMLVYLNGVEYSYKQMKISFKERDVMLWNFDVGETLELRLPY